jgi:hypothetical protein
MGEWRFTSIDIRHQHLMGVGGKMHALPLYCQGKLPRYNQIEGSVGRRATVDITVKR